MYRSEQLNFELCRHVLVLVTKPYPSLLILRTFERLRMSLPHESPTELYKIRKHQFMLYYKIVKAHTEGRALTETGIKSNVDMTWKGVEAVFQDEEFSD